MECQCLYWMKWLAIILFTSIVIFGVQINARIMKKTTDMRPPCLDAFVCSHSRKRICGLNSVTSEVRWFIDKCDILEFNCEYRTRFQKTSKANCKHVPPI